MDLPRFLSRPPKLPPAPQPPYAPTIVQLAHVATGDEERAHRLAAQALATTSGPRDAVRVLAGRLPRRTRNWPGTAPAEWIGESNECSWELLSRLGSWKPRERLALALHLVARVPRQELEDWVGPSRFTHRLAALVDEAAPSSGGRPQPDNNLACRVFDGSLLDVDEPEQGRNLRLHMLGCERCTGRVGALRTLLAALRESIEQFFPARPPHSTSSVRWVGTGLGRQWRLKRIGLVCFVVLAVVLWLGRPTASPALTGQSTRSPLTAAALVERALNRVEAGAGTGTLHERVRMGQGAETLVIERYVDLAPPHRMWLTLQQAGSDSLLLDLRTDGATRLWYTAEQRGQEPTTTSIDDPRVRDMQQLLRNLPAVGSLGSFPSAHARADVTLLAAARRAGATFLGTTEVAGRPGYLLAYRDPRHAERVVLTVDAETATLLRATAAPEDARGAATLLWQAEVVEIVPETSAPDLNIPPAVAGDAIPNPRHLLLQPFSNTSFSDLTRQYALLPMPSSLPTDTAIAYVRDGSLYGLVQVYEGTWATVAIVSHYYDFNRPQQELKERLGSTRWRLVLDDPRRSLTQLEFASAAEPRQRSWLYVWHGQLSDQERLALARRVLGTVSWVTAKEAAGIAKEFVSGERQPPQGLSARELTAPRR